MIEAVNISKKYGDKQALIDMSLRINAGEVVGLLGLNGAGKSTAMNIITGYISPDSGHVSIGGYDIEKNPMEAKRKLGYLPEHFSFYNDMKVNEYLNFICDIKKVKEGREKHISDLCDRVGISHMRGRMLKNLSKGYKQRVGFVQALLGDPDVVILDEPTVGLDPSQIVDVRRLIKEIGQKRTIIISSHLLSEAQMICSRVVLLNNGRVIADDSWDNLKQSMNERNRVTAQIVGNPEKVEEVLSKGHNFEKITLLNQKEDNSFSYLIEGMENSDIRKHVFRVLANAGFPVLSMNNNEFTLEDFFLKNVATDYENENVAMGKET